MLSAPPQSSNTLPHLNTLLGALPFGVAFFGCDLRFVDVNEVFAGTTGLASAAHVGLGLADVMPAVADEVASRLRSALETGEPVLRRRPRRALRRRDRRSGDATARSPSRRAG